MQKATATYVAPFGDNKVVEMGGVTFFDGQSVDLNSNDHPHLMSKLAGNPHFDVEMGKEEPDEKQTAQKKRGRPSNADRAAAKEAADAADKAAKDAEEKAKAAKADLESVEKAASETDGGQQPRPQTRDMKAGIDEARDYDFEQDRRDKLTTTAKAPQNAAQAGSTVTLNAGQNTPTRQSNPPEPNVRPSTETPKSGGGEANPQGFTGTSPKPTPEK